MKILRNCFRYAVVLVLAVSSCLARAGSYEDFFQAVTRNDADAINTLLQRGFDVNSRDPKGQTGLFLALRGGALSAADALFKGRGLDVDALNDVGESALMMAALKGRVDWCKRLLDRGAKVNKSGWTPLHYAATGPSIEAVQLLIERGAFVDAESPNRSTPLMMASRYGNEASVDVLLAHGADPRRINDQKLKAADFARLAGRQALAAQLDKLAP